MHNSCPKRTRPDRPCLRVAPTPLWELWRQPPIKHTFVSLASATPVTANIPAQCALPRAVVSAVAFAATRRPMSGMRCCGMVHALSCTACRQLCRCSTTRNPHAKPSQSAQRPLGISAARLCSCHVLLLLLKLLVHRYLFHSRHGRWPAALHARQAGDCREPNPQALPPLSIGSLHFTASHGTMGMGTYKTSMSRIVSCLVLLCVMCAPPSKRMS